MADQDPFTDCLCLASRRLSRLLTQIYDRALVGTGLKITQFSVLTALGRAEGRDVTLNAIAEALDLEASSLTRALDPLIREGLVTLAPGSDKRQRVGSLTRKGRTVLAEATARWRAVQLEAAEKIGAPETALLGEQLRAARRALADRPSPMKKGTAQ